jgi:enediyne polyketide synthase
VGSDPYLADHALDGDLLFPAVLGMEAMTQVATVLAAGPAPPMLENVEFLRPVIVAPGGSTTIRLAALARDPATVDVVLRSSDTDFSADHFRARLRFPRPDLPPQEAPGGPELPPVPVNPSDELYGSVLFQGKRFQRLLAYRRCSARHAVGEISTQSGAPWFAAFLPQQLVLADPGTRDAIMHGIQCCVPDATLLPQSIERLYLADPAGTQHEYVVLDAAERAQDGDSYIYDIDVRDPDGAVVERWQGLMLRAVRKRAGAGPWVPAMLGPYLERALERVLGGFRSVVVEPDPAGAEAESTAARRAQTELAVSRALDRPARLQYRLDGKPEADETAVSASHGPGLTVVVACPSGPTCDVEAVVERSAEDWAGLLGDQLLAVRDQLMADTGEAEAVASTRVWSALECVRKTGALTQAVAVEQVHDDGWVSLSAGEARIATWVTTLNDRANPVVFAVLARLEERTG